MPKLSKAELKQNQRAEAVDDIIIEERVDNPMPRQNTSTVGLKGYDPGSFSPEL